MLRDDDQLSDTEIDANTISLQEALWLAISGIRRAMKERMGQERKDGTH